MTLIYNAHQQTKGLPARLAVGKTIGQCNTNNWYRA